MIELSPRRWRPLFAAMGTAAAVRVVVTINSLGSPLGSDEDGYLVAANRIVSWLGSSSGSTEVENPLLALFWHNPGYGALVSLFALLFGDPAPALAVFQSLAGLASGWLVFALLSRSCSRPLALAGALLLWLHPSMLFFEQQVSSVSLSTLLCSALAYHVLALVDEPDSRALQWRLGLCLLPLPWLGTGGLFVVLLVAVMVGRQARLRCVGPAVALWLPAMALASLWLGMLTPLNLDAPTRVALGNNPLVWVGQGSLVGNPEAVARFRSAIQEKCGSDWTRAQVRCGARSARQIARSTVADDPSAAVRRSVFRILQTWVPDRSLADALQSGGREGKGTSRGWQLLVALIITPLHLGLLLGLALAVVKARRSPEVRFLLLAIAAWTLPVVFSVAATSLRQAVLPWVICAALFSFALVGRRSGLDRRADSGPEPE